MTGVLLLAALVPLGAAASVLGVRSPAAAIAVYAALVPVGSSIPVPGLPDPFDTLSTVVGFVATASALVHLAVAPRRAADVGPVPAWLLLAGFAGAGAGWSVDAGATIDDALLLLSLVALATSAALLHLDARDVARIDAGIAVGGAIAGAWGLVQVVTGTLPQSGAGIPRFATAGGGGEAGDPNITAAALLLPLLVAVARSLEPGQRHRLAYGAAAALTSVGVVLTVSRGGLVGLLVGLAVLALIERSGRTWALVVVLPVAALVVGLLTVPDAVEQRAQQGNTTGRAEIWDVAIGACPEWCWTGSGLGTFPDIHEAAVLEEPTAGGRILRFESHSLWLGSLIEIGLVGFALVVASLLLPGWRIRRAPRRVRAPAIAALVALAVTNTFLQNLEFKYFWLVLMYAALVRSVGAPSPTPAAAAPVRPGARRAAAVAA